MTVTENKIVPQSKSNHLAQLYLAFFGLVMDKDLIFLNKNKTDFEVLLFTPIQNSSLRLFCVLCMQTAVSGHAESVNVISVLVSLIDLNF